MAWLLRVLLCLFSTPILTSALVGMSPQLSIEEVIEYRNKVKSAFDFAYSNYLEHAWGFDELRPISCSGFNTWGGFSLSLIDSLDTLAIMGEFEEFRRVYSIVANTFDFNRDVNVSVFETNIRVIGGLLSAHLLSHIASVPNLPPGYPCEGPLLSLALDLGRRLMPAFNTASGMPYGTVNLAYGVPKFETPITCTAGVGTFIIEFATLSRLTGDLIFERTAMKAIEAMHASRSHIDLLGNHINTMDKKWTAIESGIGGGVDSFFEYLVKGSMALHQPRLMDIFYTYYDAINKHIKKDDWFFMVHKDSGRVTVPSFQSLEAFWPGLLTLIGETHQAKKSLYNYHQVARQLGFLPEMYDVANSETRAPAYPLRPEYVESLFYLYRATRDPHLLSLAAELVESIEFSTRAKCGYATVFDVNTHQLEDRMESFFLAETLKYLYLLFTISIEDHDKKSQLKDHKDHFILNPGATGRVINVDGFPCVIDSGGYVFNTEAHPIDIACLDCCRAKHIMSSESSTSNSIHWSKSNINNNQCEQSDSPCITEHSQQSSESSYSFSSETLTSSTASASASTSASSFSSSSSSFSPLNTHQQSSEDSCFVSSKDFFMQLVLDGHSSDSQWLVGLLSNPNVSFKDTVGNCDYHKNNCDFDLLTCPIESRFSRYNRYGQVG